MSKIKPTTKTDLTDQTAIGLMDEKGINLLNFEIRSILTERGFSVGPDESRYLVFIKNKDLFDIKDSFSHLHLMDDTETEIEYSDIQKICPTENDCE